MADPNPWGRNNLEAFLYYCCPECDEKCQEKGDFLHHAIQNHPNARDIYCEIDIKDELVEHHVDVPEYVVEYETVHQQSPVKSPVKSPMKSPVKSPTVKTK